MTKSKRALSRSRTLFWGHVRRSGRKVPSRLGKLSDLLPVAANPPPTSSTLRQWPPRPSRLVRLRPMPMHSAPSSERDHHADETTKSAPRLISKQKAQQLAVISGQQLAISDHESKAKALILKIEQTEDKIEQTETELDRYCKVLGQHLQDLKRLRPKSIPWQVYVHDTFGKTAQWADLMIRIGTGQTTLAALRAKRAAGMRRSRSKQKPRGFHSPSEPDENAVSEIDPTTGRCGGPMCDQDHRTGGDEGHPSSCDD